MIVRDYTKDRAGYAGRGVEALDSFCPCRPCFHPHDSGHTADNGKWVARLRCITRDNRGCPPESERAPQHETKPRGTRCVRCHTRIKFFDKPPVRW